jgi:hypothetical protein
MLSITSWPEPLKRCGTGSTKMMLFLAATAPQFLVLGLLVSRERINFRTVPVDVLPDPLHVVPVRYYPVLHGIFYTETIIIRFMK